MILILCAVAVYMAFLLTKEPLFLVSFVLMAYCLVHITLLGAAMGVI